MREVHRPLEVERRLLVAALLVRRERLAGVDRVGEHLGVAERVADAEGEDRILVVAGVADERPAVAVRAPIEVREPSGAAEAVGARRGLHACEQARHVGERAHEVALDVGADLGQARARPLDHGHDLVVAGRRGDDHPARPQVQLGAVHREPGVVRVVRAGQRAVVVVDRRIDAARDERAQAVGADDDPRAVGAAARADAGHAVTVEHERVDGIPLAHLDARGGGRVDEELVEHAAPQRVRIGHRADRRRRAAQRERPDVEGEPAGRCRARGDHLRQEPPAFEVRRARLVDVVGRERVARELGPVDQQHAVALAGEQHRRRRAGAARADHDRVVHRGLLS
jgi:hypothetical protein